MGGRWGAVLAVGAIALAGLAGCAGAPRTADLPGPVTPAHPPETAASGGAAASCVGPAVTAAPTVARSGRPVHLTGSWFHTGCADVVENGVPVETQAPLTGLVVRLEQAGSTWVLAREVSAATADGLLDLRVTLPTGLRTGPATLRVAGPDLVGDGPSVPLVVASTVAPGGRQLLRTSRRTVATALAAAPLLLAGCGNQSSSSASCVAPQVSASPTSARAAQELHVTGRWFHSG
jgi:hypothetical protein